MSLTITPPSITPPSVQPPAVIPPAIVVPDAQMISSLQARGYTVTSGTTPPPPPPSGVLCGGYHGNNQASPVLQHVMLDYCDNNATTYNFTPGRIAYMANTRAMVKCGVLTDAQAAAFAQVMIAGGQPNAFIPHMWENDQGVNVWETNWNELKYSASVFKTQMLRQIAVMDAQPGADFTHCWCPNLNQQGNQAAGRTQTDTCPGPGPNKNIVVAPDGYDSSGDTTDVTGILAQCAVFETAATANGMVFAGLCETGLNNGSNNTTPADDPKFWTDLLNHAQTSGWLFVVNFAILTSQGGSFNSDNGPKSIAAIQSFYA